MTVKFERYERDGMVAVLYSPGYGAGWYSWNEDHKGLVFDSEIVEVVMLGDREGAAKIARAKYGENVYLGGADDLAIEWVPAGFRFEITEYDGFERVRVFGPDDGLVA